MASANPPTPARLLDAPDEVIAQQLAALGQPAFRSKQVRRWLFRRRARDWQQMTDLPQAVRDQLTADAPLWSGRIAKHTQADDGTEKLLMQFDAGGQVECVLLRDRVRRTFCISTQVGCGMGCVFCASGLDGVDRNLSTGEILEQMLRLKHLLADDEELTHIVVMGMGEPLANLDNLLPALAEANRSDGLDVGARRITISTVGLPKAIDRLSREASHYRLAISLHAPNDRIRDELVPVNDKIGVGEILAAADRFFEVSGRRLTFEYVLLAELNDRPEHARELARRLVGREALVNIIPYNPVAGLPYKTPSTASQQQFRAILEEAGIRIRFRHRKGDRIDAACGQLRRNHVATVSLDGPQPTTS